MVTATQPQGLWDVPRALEFLGGISRRKLGSMLAPKGDLPCVRLGGRVMFDPRDLAAYVERCKIEPVAK